MKLTPLTLALPALLLAACERDDPVAPLRPAAEPLMQISDARSSGRAHFYFLPPMASQPAYAGAFDGSLLPLVTVEVCELAGTACGAQVARFTAAAEGLERVTTSPYFEHYLAIWRTDGANASVGSTYRVTVTSGGEALGYADVKVVRTLAEARAVDRTQFAVAVKGFPLLIRFRIETGAVFPVGPEGGIVTAAEGVVQLEFPAGAVSNVIGVTVAPATDLPADAAAPVAETAFDFGPDGATFATPVKLTIRYPNGTPDEAQLRLHKLVGNAWQMVANSTVDVENNSVSGDVSGFSEYAVLPARPDPGLVGDIAFLSQRGDPSVNASFEDVFLMKEDGSTPINLTNNPDWWRYPRDLAWSPAGDKLAVVYSDTYSDTDIRVIGATAADFRIFPGLSPDERSLVWAPPGPRGDLFFTSNFQIFSLHSARGAPQPLTITGLPLARDPSGTIYTRIECGASRFGDYWYLNPEGPLLAVSANGAHIAFTYRETCEVTRREDGSLWRREAQSVGFANVATGQVIGDVSEFNEFSHTYSAGAEGDISIGELYIGPPYAWSPTDANKIVVTMNEGGEDPDGVGQLILVDIAAKTVVPLLTKTMFGISCQFENESFCEGDWNVQFHGAGGLRGLAWSPAGDKLAFGMLDPGDRRSDDNGFPILDGDGDGWQDYDIWVLDVSVTPHVIRNLTSSSEGNEYNPTWSADGTKIVFVSDRHSNLPDLNEEIYVLNIAEPGSSRRLTVNPLSDRSPRWRP